MSEYTNAMVLKLTRELAQMKADLEAQIRALKVRVANLERASKQDRETR